MLQRKEKSLLILGCLAKKELEERNYDLSAKNPNVKEEKILRTSEEILNSLEENLKLQNKYLKEIKDALKA